jgi:hypothetical protein
MRSNHHCHQHNDQYDNAEFQKNTFDILFQLLHFFLLCHFAIPTQIRYAAGLACKKLAMRAWIVWLHPLKASLQGTRPSALKLLKAARHALVPLRGFSSLRCRRRQTFWVP